MQFSLTYGLLQQNFKWEEQNYVVQNKINNLAFLVNKDNNISKVTRILPDLHMYNPVHEGIYIIF